MKEIKTGLYRHYKGAEYEVLGTTMHSETEELLVLYRALYGEFGLWVRPLSMFQESVELDGVTIERFQLVKPYPVTLGSFDSQANSL